MEIILTKTELEATINATKQFLQDAEVFLSSMDEARQTCQICHKRPRYFEWTHWGKNKCGWRKICHGCFLKIKKCPFCRHNVETRR